jgi:hypothetical protein
MKSLLMVAVGVWIGRGIYLTLAKNQAREREVYIRKALEKFLQEQLPELSATDKKKEIDNILKTSFS